MDWILKICFMVRDPWSYVLLLCLILILPATSTDAQLHEFNINQPLKSQVELHHDNYLHYRPRRLGSGRFPKRNRKKNAPTVSRFTEKQIEKIRSMHRPGASSAPSVTDLQRENLMRLTAGGADGQAVKVVFDNKNGTPTLIKLSPQQNRLLRQNPRNPKHLQNTALQFLINNRQLLKLNDPGQELALMKSWSDKLGTSHFKYQQLVAGIPVMGKQITVHLDSRDSVYLFTGRYDPSPQTYQSRPAVTEAAALEAVRAHLGRSDLTDGDIELVFFSPPDSDQMVLAYKVEIAPELTEAWVYLVDAITGYVIQRRSKIRHELVPAAGYDLNGSLQRFNAWHQNGVYYLIDPSMPGIVEDIDYLSAIQSPGNTYILNADYGLEQAELIGVSAPTRGWERSGVSVMTHIRAIHNYYSETFDRYGLDDNGMNYLAVVNVGFDPPNAGWDGEAILIGAGNNIEFRNLAGSLDVITHELQHAITEFMAGLNYENQSGALNEAYSDIFACMVDDEDWIIGEDTTLMPPGFLRNLADPSQGVAVLPSRMSDYVELPNTEEGDWGGVHINMSIPSYAGYLMAEGLSDNIGRDRTAQIWYRALENYLLPNARFEDARDAMIQAAEELYGAEEAAIVQRAWDRVEVYANSSPNSSVPTPGSLFSKNDLMLYLSPLDPPQDSPQDTNERFDLFAMQLSSNNSVQSVDIGPLNHSGSADDQPRFSKPTAYTTPSGDTLIYYATQDFDLHRVVLHADGTYDAGQEISDAKRFFSIAVSPNGRYLAHTTPDLNENQIHILDLENGRNLNFDLESPEINRMVIHADALAFDATGKTLAFDALNCFSTSTDGCREGEGDYYYSIGFLSLADDPTDPAALSGSISFPFADQDPNIDILNPSFAANSSDILALDIVDYRRYPQIDATVLCLNINNGQSQVITPMDSEIDGLPLQGVPSFWADNSAVTIQGLNRNMISAYRVAINENYEGQGNHLPLGNGPVALPVMHSQAVFSSGKRISFSTPSLNFKNIPAGGHAAQKLVLSNFAGEDIHIQDIAINGDACFTHDGTPGILRRKNEMVITVTYAPKTLGPHSATLSILSDAAVPTRQISITGNAETTLRGGGNSGGCMINTLGNPLKYKKTAFIWIFFIGYLIVLTSKKRQDPLL